MKHMGAMLLRKEPFKEIVMGNTALVRGMVEAGVRVATSYPGSPTPEIAVAIQSIPGEDRPFYFEFSTNEKVAAEIAFGAAVNGHLSTVFFKSVGLNVALDSFVQFSLSNIIGGLVVVLGDDPGANSSQNEQDNRRLAYMSYTPVLEPANPSEVYSFFKEAARISSDKRMPVILRLTTHVCHAKEKVSFQGWTPQKIDNTPRFDAKNGPYIPLTAQVFPKKRVALKKLDEVEALANESTLNQWVDHQNKDRGIITMGMPFLSLMEVLENVRDKPDILKLGVVYPAPKDLIRKFLAGRREVKVMEELDNVLEQEIKSLAYDDKLSVRIIGKTDHEDWVGEYTPDKVRDVLAKTWPELLPPARPKARYAPEAPIRPPQMCPGCGHRSAFHAVKKAVSDADITVADIGCHSLGYLPPYEMGELLLCMGASTAIGSGMNLFNDERKVVVFMGDSTFFHAALPGVVNAVFNNHNITMLLMENGVTAMTGHQDHPASGRNFNGPTDKIPLRSVLEGLGVRRIYEVDAYQQSKLTELTRKAMEDDEFSVVIARHPCMLKFMRTRRRKPGFRPKRVDIDQQKCERAHVCVEEFGCPTFTRGEDGLVTINPDLCIGDGSCLQTCPHEAITRPSDV